MTIKKFSKFVEEGAAPASDYVPKKDSDAQVNGKEPQSAGEKNFYNMHNVSKQDYTPSPGQDHVFNGSIKEEVESDEDEESELSEGKVMDSLRDIVKTKGSKKVKFANGKSVTIDMTTANAMVNLYNKLNDKNKEKMDASIEKSPDMLMKLMDVAFGKGK